MHFKNYRTSLITLGPRSLQLSTFGYLVRLTRNFHKSRYGVWGKLIRKYLCQLLLLRVALKRDWLNWKGKMSCQKLLLYPAWSNQFACRLIKDVEGFANSEVGTVHKLISSQVHMAVTSDVTLGAYSITLYDQAILSEPGDQQDVLCICV